MKKSKYIDYSHVYFYFAPSVYLVTIIGGLFRIPVINRLMRIFFTPFIYFWIITPFVLWGIMVMYERLKSIKRSKEVNAYRLMSVLQPIIVILFILINAIALLWLGSPV